MARGALDLDALTPAEQLELLDDIWARLSKNPSNVPLTPEQARELDDRDVDLERDIKAGKPWGEPWSDARERL
jgi:putative addiction module component (TIGR02574 family)